MLLPEYTSRFKKDIKTLQKRRLDIEALKGVIRLLCAETAIDPKHRDHQLTGLAVDIQGWRRSYCL